MSSIKQVLTSSDLKKETEAEYFSQRYVESNVKKYCQEN